MSQDGTVVCDEPEPPQYSAYFTPGEEYWCDGTVANADPTGMCLQVDEYVCEQGIPACAPIGPGCLTMEIVEDLMNEDPNEAWYVSDEPVGIVVSCPS
ncbi:MAG: hypothetical protein BA864_00985 [Desulfuromonadales bacterium C00003093]|nr:MAG: hypothetical protein BA864_00985 [Desulfuromonadales bacterium C00003093]